MVLSFWRPHTLHSAAEGIHAASRDGRRDSGVVSFTVVIAGGACLRSAALRPFTVPMPAPLLSHGC